MVGYLKRNKRNTGFHSGIVCLQMLQRSHVCKMFMKMRLDLYKIYICFGSNQNVGMPRSTIFIETSLNT